MSGEDFFANVGPGSFARQPVAMAGAPGAERATPIRQSIDQLRRSLDVRRAGGAPGSLSGHPVTFGSGSDLASLGSGCDPVPTL